jgi:hypothetical protein
VNNATSSVHDFKPGDKVRVTSAWLAKPGDIYTVEHVTDTHVTAANGTTRLCYRKDKWGHV